MNYNDSKTDIILIHIDTWMSCSTALAILEPVLNQNGIRSLVIKSSDLEKYIDQADIFGISVMDHTYSEAKKITQQLQNKTVIWGGCTPTAVPEFILRENPGVDYLVLQEGEKRLIDLIRSFTQPEMLKQIDGIAYRDENNEIILHPPVEFVDMNTLPFQSDLAYYNNTVYIELSRGCYGKCRYCQEIHQMRFKNPVKCAEEIQYWYDKGMTNFYLGNANSLANGHILQKLIDELEARKLSIDICLVGRPEDVLRNYDILERIFQSSNLHLYLVEVGIEANTQRVLDLLGRGTTPDINRKAVTALIGLKAVYSHKTIVSANMILFSHYDMTIEDFIENVRFIGEYNSSKDVVSLSLVGLANTPVWQNMRDRGFKPDAVKGLQIYQYPFTDHTVNRLYQIFSSYQNRKYLKKNGSVTFWDYKAVQRQIYNKILDFYASENIRESVMTFIYSTEFEG